MKIPWGHHIVIIGKSKGNRDKALFYVRNKGFLGSVPARSKPGFCITD